MESWPCREYQDGGDAAGGVGEVPHLLGVHVSAEDLVLAVGEPLLEDLVAAQLVGPDGGGYVVPAGVAVEVDVEGAVAECAGGVTQGLSLGGV